MSQQESVSKNPRAPRSPSYPCIDLETAVARVEKLNTYAPNGKSIPVDLALKQWSYKSKSGAGLQQLAALLKFGLLEGKGKKDQRSVLVTQRARRIIHQAPDRHIAIRDAALEPTIHSEIYQRWPHGLPDNSTIRPWLLLEKVFNEKVVDSIISEMRQTFEYAKLDSEPSNGDNIEGEDNDSEVSVGSWVQWTSKGVAQFPKPRKVVEISEKDGQEYVCILQDNGEKGWCPMSEVSTNHAIEADQTSPKITIMQPSSIPLVVSSGLKEDKATIGSSQSIWYWPNKMNSAEYQDLDYWAKGVLAKAKRSVTDPENLPDEKD